MVKNLDEKEWIDPFNLLKCDSKKLKEIIDSIEKHKGEINLPSPCDVCYKKHAEPYSCNISYKECNGPYSGL